MAFRSTFLATAAAFCAAFSAVPSWALPPDSEGDFPKNGLVLWLSAERVEVASGNAVKSMKDRSGNANPAVHLGAGHDQSQPKLAADPVSGLPVLSFSGAMTGLGFNRVSDIRTTFWVLSKDSSKIGNCEERTALGDSNSCDFHPGCQPDGIFNIYADSGHTSPFVANGKTYLNGEKIDPVQTLYPSKLALISVVTTGNCRANQIGKDRDIGRSWVGTIAEILLYNVPLSDTDRTAVETYFIRKYGLDGKPPAKYDGGTGSETDAAASSDTCCAAEAAISTGSGGANGSSTGAAGAIAAGGTVGNGGDAGRSGRTSAPHTGGSLGQAGKSAAGGSGSGGGAAFTSASSCNCRLGRARGGLAGIHFFILAMLAWAVRGRRRR